MHLIHPNMNQKDKNKYQQRTTENLRNLINNMDLKYCVCVHTIIITENINKNKCYEVVVV